MPCTMHHTYRPNRVIWRPQTHHPDRPRCPFLQQLAKLPQWSPYGKVAAQGALIEVPSRTALMFCAEPVHPRRHWQRAIPHGHKLCPASQYMRFSAYMYTPKSSTCISKLWRCIFTADVASKFLNNTSHDPVTARESGS